MFQLRITRTRRASGSDGHNPHAVREFVLVRSKNLPQPAAGAISKDGVADAFRSDETGPRFRSPIRDYSQSDERAAVRFSFRPDAFEFSARP